MKNNIKQTKRFLFPILALVILSIITISSINAYLNINLFEKHINQDINLSKKNFLKKHSDDIKKQVEFMTNTIDFQKSRVEEQLKKELLVRINIARSICEFVYSTYKDKLNEHQMRQMVATQLASVRFDKGNRGYYFAYQNSTRIVYEHIHKETIGTYMGDVKDTKGVNVALAHDRALEGGKEIGLLKRYFYKPGNRKDGFPKLVAVTLFKPLDLLIGTGEYLDVIEKKIKEYVINRFENFNVSKNMGLGVLELHNIEGGEGFATVLINSHNKKIIGTKIDDDFKDAKGVEYRKKYLRILKQNGEALLKHWYVKTNEDKQKPVYSYFYLQKDWDWIIVSSFYLDSLEKQIKQLEKSLEEYRTKTIKDTVFTISLLSIFVILIAVSISLMIDRTIRKYTGEILKNKTELELAQEVAKMGSWYQDHKNDKLSVSNETFNIFEIEKDDKKLSIDTFRSKVHPDDLKAFDKAYGNSLLNRLLSLRYRLLMEDGRVKIIESKGETIFDSKNKPIFSNGTVHDITKEYEKNEELKKKEKLLIEKEKLASMGEMVGNIAHQWRQPLSVISTCATGMSVKKEFNTLDDEELKRNCEIINDNAQYLSQTIEDFRNFIKGDRIIQTINLKENLNSFLHLVDGISKGNNINIILNVDNSLSVVSYANELIQCYINIFNNAKDAFNINNIKPRVFKIDVLKSNNEIIIKMRDNAGGIPKDILPKIFDPYFTTKHKSQGTGLGLNMTYRLITEGMKGNIIANNVEFTYENEKYMGAEFKISLPVSF